MIFSEMPYNRPDIKAAEEQLTQLTERLKAADSYEAAREVFLEQDRMERKILTQSTIASIRHSVDTRIEFYKNEYKFWNEAMPELEEYIQQWTAALLNSRWRDDFEKEFGKIIFTNAEIALKTFSPEIISEMQEENNLVQEYQNLIASAQIPFEDGVYTISQMTPFKNDADDDRRLAAWKAEGQWYKDNQEKLDEIYDRLTHLRDLMGRKLGYGGYTQLGYYRMERNCYTKDDVQRFREAVQKYLVPVADKIFRDQAKRLDKEYPMSFADNQLEFRNGNPKPVGIEYDKDQSLPFVDKMGEGSGRARNIVMAGKKFYDALSPETGEFFNKMLDMEMMDLLSTEGKEGGGYCTELPDYDMPFIFANFNGTQGDVEVVTHEAGHAFASYMNRDRVPVTLMWPSLEACEVHSMSMEFLAWPWSEDFFGEDADKFRYSHLAAALKFIPYGTMVDHFQHIVYERPEMTPKDRHGVWKELLGIYMPWMKLDGDIPFYSEGEGWQRQQHIYCSPFYYIDYCLAQTVSLEFWAMNQEDRDNAWKHYMAYTRQGGTETFVDLLANAGLESPFDENCLRKVCSTAMEWLTKHEL